jgi:hypothetical protein
MAKMINRLEFKQKFVAGNMNRHDLKVTREKVNLMN